MATPAAQGVGVMRRFPAPWRTEKMPGGYVVRDANDQALAYVYSRANEAEAMQAKVLTEGAADRGQHCEAAGVADAGGMIGPPGSSALSGRNILGGENQT